MSKIQEYKKVIKEQINREGLTKENKLIEHLVNNIRCGYTFSSLIDFCYIEDKKAKWGRRLYSFRLSSECIKIFSIYTDL